MTREHYFKHAKWVGAPKRTPKDFSVLRGHFSLEQVGEGKLSVLALGFFRCYINGTLINPDTFLPLSSDFEAGCDPVGEQLSGHRVYVSEFDISPFLHLGDNVIALHYGGGWYTFPERLFGLPKAIWCIVVKNAREEVFVSDESCRISSGYVQDYYFTRYEHHDYTRWQDAFREDFNDENWDFAVETEGVESEYCTTHCPADGVFCEITPKLLKESELGAVYDCGRNTTGYPVIENLAPQGEEVTVLFSEEISPEGDLEPGHCHKQRFSFVSDGKRRAVQAEFLWYGFRYMKITGKARVLSVKEIFAQVPVTSEFSCDDETLNWIYETFVHTMRCNMHTGHPSDCPHLERRGYTGDGQLTCHAALTVFDAEAFYRKWLQDIADSQDLLSGHVQYTAPYLRSGGGPGGWGCAIVEVPYQIYRHTGDASVLEKYYPKMRRYLDYLEEHSENGLVTSDKKGEWCLGDWCGPVILYPDLDITAHNQQVMLPAPLVNNYFMIKSLNTMAEIARVLHLERDAEEYLRTAEIRKSATRAAYFNTFDDNFVMNVQGANAFAADLDLGTENTYKNLVSYYRKLGHYDTGIFATDVLTRVLFERGDGDLAVDLLTNDGDQGFAHWKKTGATSFHEYWDSNRSRSHNHPMFGAVVAYLFEHLLGIGQEKGSAGYRELLIAPKAYRRFGKMKGSIQTPQGRVSVSYEKTGNGAEFRITVPKNTRARFFAEGKEVLLSVGENRVTL